MWSKSIKGAFYNLLFHHLLMQHKANLSTQVSLKHLLDYQLTFKRNCFYSWENDSFHFPEKFWSQIIKGLQHIWEKPVSWLHHRWKNDERAMVTIDTLTHRVCSNSRPEPYVFYASFKFPELLLNPDVASQKCALEANDAQGESVKHISINAGLNLLMSSYNVSLSLFKSSALALIKRSADSCI